MYRKHCFKIYKVNEQHTVFSRRTLDGASRRYHPVSEAAPQRQNASPRIEILVNAGLGETRAAQKEAERQKALRALIEREQEAFDKQLQKFMFN